MSLTINYIDAPEGAQEKMTVIGENGSAISDSASVASGADDIAYATFEPGIWKLDGTMKILPDDPKAGFWSSEVSRQDPDNPELNGFNNPPVLTLTFPIPYASTGFTFTFSPSTNQWCNKIHIIWYSGQSQVISMDYYPTGPKWTLEEVIESFDRMEVTLLSTNKPGDFAKVQRIEIGRNVLFDAREIVSARLVNEVDPTLCSLPADMLTFDMHDSQNRTFLPQENQRIELIKDGVLRAVQYIKTSTRKSKSDYSIRCQSSIGLLNDEFLGGLYMDKPVKELLTEILGEWEYSLSSTFAGKRISGYIPVCSQRDALQQVAFAIGAMVTTQDSSKIQLRPVPTTVASKFTESEIVIGGSAKTASRYARVEVYSHSYVKTDTVETLIDEETVSGEDVLYTFRYPHYDYEITGGEITGFGDNWVTVTANGLVTLNAKTYIHNTRVHVKRNPEATAKERGNYISIKEATLIHAANVQEAVNRLYSAVQRRQTVNQQVVVTNQRAGQMASSLTPWETITKGVIISMDSTITQTGHIADIQMQGVEVKMESVWMYAGEIYSGGQEVLY